MQRHKEAYRSERATLEDICGDEACSDDMGDQWAARTKENMEYKTWIADTWEQEGQLIQYLRADNGKATLAGRNET